jgi:5-dehydro-2-deoxygluconokinase
VEIAIITDGINGSYANDRNGDIFQSGVCSQEKAVERTGAGDSFASGFLFAILNNYNIEDALKYGAVNAESVIRKIGSQEGLLTKNEIEEKITGYNNLKTAKI